MLSCAVIGCGPAGMAASTALRQKGAIVTCFELAPDSGGLWNSNGYDAFTPRGLLSPIYSSMRCVLPKDFMAFSDQRFPYQAPQFPHHAVVRQYLQDYASFKGVRAITRFNTKIESIRWDTASSKWKLIAVNVVNGDVHEWAFDRVAVCTGQHHRPRFPREIEKDKAQETLRPFLDQGGEVWHSAHLKNMRAFRGKKVLVVGDGIGAYDMMRELQRNGADITHSTSRKGLSQQEEANEGKASKFLSLSRLLRNEADPVSYLGSLLSLIPGLRTSRHHAKSFMESWMRFESSALRAIPRVGPIQSIGRVDRAIVCEEDPHATLRKSEVLEESLRRGVQSSSSESASETTGQEEPEEEVPSSPKKCVMVDHVDAIVFATGYHLSFPFLHESIRREVEGHEMLQLSSSEEAGASSEKEKRSSEDVEDGNHNRGLYMGVVYNAEPTLAFVGTQRELMPPFLMFQAQSEFVANVFTNRLPLAETPEERWKHELSLCETNPCLTSLYSSSGLGLHSAEYFNLLAKEQGALVPRSTMYSRELWKRNLWVVGNGILMAISKFRSMAPLKRKKQHVLFSNKI